MSDHIQDKSNYKDLEITTNNGKSSFLLFDFIKTKWNRGEYYEIYKSENRSVDVQDKNLKIRFSKNQPWTPVHKLRFRFEFKESYWFNYVAPSIYRELKNEMENKIIYGEYGLSLEELMDFKDWEEIKESSSQLKNIPQTFELEFMSIITNKEEAEIKLIETPRTK